MRNKALGCAAALVLIGSAAAAQPRPIFDVDDFVDPRQHEGAVFISRLVLGAAANLVDDYRPLHDDAAFIHISNSFYWREFQFDYEHSEVRGTEDRPPVQVCRCSPPIYFPTPPPHDATPAAPAPGSRDTLQMAWYRIPSAPGTIPTSLRYRLSWSHQRITTTVTSAATGERVERLSGREQSLALDADTLVRIRGRDVFGSLQYAGTVRSGTVDDRSQHALTYTNRFPAVSLRRVSLRPTLTIGGVSGRSGTAINVVNPSFEAFWHDTTTRINVHLVWSPQSTRSGAEGWQTTHQIALFLDRALYVKLFRPRVLSAAR